MSRIRTLHRRTRFAALALLATAVSPAMTHADHTPAQYRKLTPILFATDVQACLDFWTRLGGTVTAAVPGEDSPVFAILDVGQAEIMYQSFEAARADNAALVERVDRSMIFLEVDSLDAVLERLGDAETLVPEHTTDYGAREIYVRDPAGNVIGFSQQGAAPAD